jgi:Ser/Thr protein kinase RdoA (MazF antagonist)
MPLENWQENLSPWAVGSSGQRYLQMLDSKLKLLLETAMSFPAQIIHGDLHVGNLLWIQDDLTLLDFDECSFGPIAQDFWLLAPGRESWAQKARQSLIQGYRELRECQEYQDSDFEVLRALRLVRYNLWIASRFEDPAFQAQFPHFGKDRWWEEESEAWLRATE